MRRKDLVTGVCLTASIVGVLLFSYRRALRVTSRAYKNAKDLNVEE